MRCAKSSGESVREAQQPAAAHRHLLLKRLQHSGAPCGPLARVDRGLPRLGLAALLLAPASPGMAATDEYRSTRPKTRPSVAASCSGFTMLQADEEPPGAARASGRAVRARGPAWRREGLRQHLRYYRAACPDADASPLRRAAPRADAR